MRTNRTVGRIELNYNSNKFNLQLRAMDGHLMTKRTSDPEGIATAKAVASRQPESDRALADVFLIMGVSKSALRSRPNDIFKLDHKLGENETLTPQILDSYPRSGAHRVEFKLNLVHIFPNRSNISASQKGISRSR